MQIPTSFTTVTTFSKLFALIVFVTFPIVGFYLGYQYHRLSTPINTQYLTKTVVKSVPYKESSSDIFKRCGDFPLLPKTSFGSQAIHVSGPLWSPDCRNIAWSNYLFIYGNEGDDTGVTNELWKSTPSQAPIGENGIYVYSAETKNVSRIYTPLTAYEYPVLINWINQRKILFSVGEARYEYSIKTGETTIAK